MNSSSRPSVSVLLAASAFLVMAGLGWIFGGAPEPSAGQKVERASSKSTDRSSWSRRKERASHSRRQIDGIRWAGSEQERMRATIALASSLSPSQFGDWIDGGWFNYRAGPELTIFRRILEERWRSEDPEGFVEWCLGGSRKGSGSQPEWAVSIPQNEAIAILADWALNDPERLSAYFDKHPDEALQGRLLARLASKDPALVAKLLQELAAGGLSQSARGNLQSVVASLAKESPETLERILDSLPASLRFQAETALVGQRLSSSFEEEIRALWERPDGWKLFSANLYQVKEISEKLLEELPNLPASWRNSLATGPLFGLMYSSDSEPWFRADLEGAGFTPEQAQQIRSTALSALVHRKPEMVLELLPDAGLNDSARRNVISNLFSRARSDPEKAAKWLAMLDSEADREAAQATIDRTSQSQTLPSITTPDDWLEFVTSSEATRRLSNSAYALRNWDRGRNTELAERFAQLPSEQKDMVAKTLSDGFPLERVAPELSGEVIRHMLSAPEPEGDGQRQSMKGVTRMASATAVRWVIEDPGAASTWVESLPAGEAKLWARKNMAATWADYDPDAARQWIGTLEPEARGEVERFLGNPEGE